MVITDVQEDKLHPTYASGNKSWLGVGPNHHLNTSLPDANETQVQKNSASRRDLPSFDAKCLQTCCAFGLDNLSQIACTGADSIGTLEILQHQAAQPSGRGVYAI